MSDKKARRQQAMRKDKRKKRLIAAVCVTLLLTLVVLLVVGQIQQRGTRVYISGRNSVTLNGNGTFTASLPHGVVREGTFSQSTTDGVTTVTFSQDGMAVAVNGTIEGNVLTIPDEWDDGHSHPRNYTLRP